MDSNSQNSPARLLGNSEDWSPHIWNLPKFGNTGLDLMAILILSTELCNGVGNLKWQRGPVFFVGSTSHFLLCAWPKLLLLNSLALLSGSVILFSFYHPHRSKDLGGWFKRHSCSLTGATRRSYDFAVLMLRGEWQLSVWVWTGFQSHMLLT